MSNARLTIVSSEVHGYTQFPQQKEPSIFKALADASKYNVDEGYPNSKLLEVLVVRELAPKLANSGVILNMLNPGLCHSGLNRNGSWILAFMKLFIARSTEVGSRTLVAAGVAGPESHGKYMSDGKVNEDALSEFARSKDGEEAGQRVWKELSEILEGIDPGVTRNL
jgi:NAD(P)-dependent dehydrogenase (short-subunit alcohol dehydrogenase family)